MPEFTKKQILEMARMAGLVPDDQRAEVIGARLGAVLEALSEVPDASLVDFQPALTFAPAAAPFNDERATPGE